MRLTLKRVFFIAWIAFILGSIPSITVFLKEFASFSFETGVMLSPRFHAAASEIAGAVRQYAWHILIAYTIIISMVIFMENQNPDRTILWLLTLALLPVAGLLIYFIFGPEFSYQKVKKRFAPGKGLPPPASETSGDSRLLLERLLFTSSGAEIMPNNKIKIFTDGREKFDALKADIRRATCCINMQYFVIKDDYLGQEISEELAAAARRGVKIRLLYDAVGSFQLPRGFIRRLAEAGVECHSFMPMSFPRLRRKMNFRNHRKIAVIDNTIAYTGGFNIGKEYLGDGPLGYWRDTHVRFEGDAVQDINKIFLQDWCFRSGDDPTLITDERAADFCEPLPVTPEAQVPPLPMQVVASGVNSPWHPISQGFFNMIARAGERMWITSPYFVPGASFMRAVTSTALAGVDVRLLLPSKKDHFLVFWGSRSNYENLLRAGVRIFLYKKGFIHAKILLADDEISSVGTCNMDERSLHINFENQLFIYDKDVNAEFAAQFEKDLDDSQEIELDEWVKRPLWQKVIESFARIFSAQI